jgi:hypothetical protein
VLSLLAPIHTKASSLSSLSLHEHSSLFLSQFSLVLLNLSLMPLGRRRRRVLRSSGLHTGSFHGRSHDDVVDARLRRVEIDLRQRARHPAMWVLLLDLRWHGSSSSMVAVRVLLSYDDVDARCL